MAASGGGSWPSGPGSSRSSNGAAARMKVDAAAGPAVMASGVTGSVSVALHPLVILNISDHWIRMRSQEGRPIQVIGALIGRQEGRNIEVMNSFELLSHTVEENVIIDKEYYYTKEEQFKQVFKDLEFLGWYTTGGPPDQSDIHVHKQVCEIIESPLFLKLNPMTKHTDLPVSVFESVIDIINGEATMLFAELTYTLATEEAERIGADDVARMTATGSGENSTVAEHLIAQHSAIKMLHSRVKLILEYVKASEPGEVPFNHEILRKAYALCHCLSTDKFKTDFYHEIKRHRKTKIAKDIADWQLQFSLEIWKYAEEKRRASEYSELKHNKKTVKENMAKKQKKFGIELKEAWTSSSDVDSESSKEYEKRGRRFFLNRETTKDTCTKDRPVKDHSSLAINILPSLKENTWKRGLHSPKKNEGFKEKLKLPYIEATLSQTNSDMERKCRRYMTDWDLQHSSEIWKRDQVKRQKGYQEEIGIQPHEWETSSDMDSENSRSQKKRGQRSFLNGETKDKQIEGALDPDFYLMAYKWLEQKEMTARVQKREADSQRLLQQLKLEMSLKDLEIEELKLKKESEESKKQKPKKNARQILLWICPNVFCQRFNKVDQNICTSCGRPRRFYPHK